MVDGIETIKVLNRFYFAQCELEKKLTANLQDKVLKLNKEYILDDDIDLKIIFWSTDKGRFYGGLYQREDKIFNIEAFTGDTNPGRSSDFFVFIRLTNE